MSRKELDDEMLMAAEVGQTDAVQSLLDRGANIDAKNEDGETALHMAAFCGGLDTVRLLLDRGAAIDTQDGAGSRETALIKAAKGGHSDTVRLLLDRGSEIYATAAWGQTALDFAASNGRLDTVVLLLERGANMEATAEYRTTALNEAAANGYPDIVQLLVQRGADIHALNQFGKTALHSAASKGELDCVVALLEHGGNMEAIDQYGRSVLHEAAICGNSALVRVLLERGANIQATSRLGQTPLSCAIQLTIHSSDAKAHYDTAQTLCELGAVWDESCNEDSSTTTDRQILTSTGGIRACVRYWIEQRARDPSATLAPVPIENVNEGKESVETYLNAIANTAMEDVVRRRKLCVIGPSCSGKTSLVKSLQEFKTVMVDIEDRTIGIDLFGLDWKAAESASESGKYEATIWDFAGQDVYQVAHSLYFSKRTLYLVFVNVEKYQEQLQLEDDDIKQYEARLSRWVRDNVFSWVQLILGRQPDAELVIVCSKCDKVDSTIVATVVEDLQERLASWATEFVSEHDGAVQQEIQKSVEEFADRERLRLSIVTQDTVEMALRDVQRAVTERPERAYLMPKLYTLVLNTVNEIRSAAAATASEAGRVEKLLVQSDKLVEDLLDKIDRLKRRECRDILGTLHALGDILWFEQERHLMAAGSSTIVLDPRLMLDLVREVVNHELHDRDGPEYEVLRTHGELKHSLLSTFPLWRALCEQSPERVLYFKQLLKHFNLAYPVGSHAMAWDADLIVPSYWKTKRQPAGVAVDAVSASVYAHEATWQYTVPANVSVTIFDQFIVQSHDVGYDRSVMSTGVVMAKPDLCHASIAYNEGKKPTEDVIVIRVDAESIDECWKTLQFLVESMERVLEGYPGLGAVRRHVLKKGPRKTAEYDVLRLIKNQVCDAATMVAKVKALLHPPSAGA